MRPHIALSGLLVLASCTPPWADCPPLQPSGTATDVATKPGSYNGYAVSSQCLAVEHNGIGAADLAVLRAALAARLDRAGIFYWTSTGAGCERSQSLTLYLDDWRNVDTAIAIAGELVRDLPGYAEVIIEVTAVPSAC